MSYGGGGGGRGGFSGGLNVGAARVGVDGSNGVGGGLRIQSGLHPQRAKGFGMGQARVETPSLNDMRARQGAIVAKFMTFLKRKCSLVVEMYETSFYRQKPNWEKIADFIHNDLCTTAELRKGVQDVQFHPVKMLLFVRFSDENLRDSTVARLQSAEGVIWSDYKVKVKGYSLDAQVKFIRLLGVSPETGEDEIRRTILEVGIGEMIELKKGLLDSGRLPGVTNGTWSMRVKILDPDKVIPSYIHRRDEGELWSLNFEGRIFCCWKCGSGTHIGDKCRDQTRTFDEIFSGGVDTNEGESAKPTWAAVVRSGQGESEGQRNRVMEMERKLKEDNLRKDRERIEIEKQKRLEEEEIERQKQQYAAEREKAINKAASDAQKVLIMVEDEVFVDSEDDLELSRLANNSEKIKIDNLNVSQILEPDSVSEAGFRANVTAVQHIAWLEARSVERLVREPMNIVVNPELERIFGPGATRLAIEHELGGPDQQAGEGRVGSDGHAIDQDNVNVAQIDERVIDDVIDQSDQENVVASPPKERRSRRRKRGKSKGGSSKSLSPERRASSVWESGSDVEIDLIAFGSSSSLDVLSESGGNSTKKLKLDDEAMGAEEIEGNVKDNDTDLAAGKGEGSSQNEEISAGVTNTGGVLLPGSSGGEDFGAC